MKWQLTTTLGYQIAQGNRIAGRSNIFLYIRCRRKKSCIRRTDFLWLTCARNIWLAELKCPWNFLRGWITTSYFQKNKKNPWQLYPTWLKLYWSSSNRKREIYVWNKIGELLRIVNWLCLLCENRIETESPIHLSGALEKVYFTQPKISEPHILSRKTWMITLNCLRNSYFTNFT